MTRPRPVGPALAGAVDLSALKQPPPSASGAAAGSSGSGGTEITEANFEAEVLVRSGQVPVVVLLWTPRSPASAQLAEVFSALADQDGGTWSFATVNVDVVPQIAQAFGVQGVPTVVAIAAGRPLDSFQGTQPPEQLRAWIDSLLQATAGKLSGGPQAAEQVDPALDHARNLWDDGELDAAEAAFQAIVDDTAATAAAQAEAKDALRQIAFIQRAMTQSADAIAAAAAAPDDVDLAFAAADVEIAGDDATAAFERLTALVKRTAGDERTRVRTRLVELFDLFPPDDPRVIAGRRALANALY